MRITPYSQGYLVAVGSVRQPRCPYPVFTVENTYWHMGFTDRVEDMMHDTAIKTVGLHPPVAHRRQESA